MQAGGYRLETETFDKMQTAYELFNSLGEIIGKRAIIKGCEIVGNRVKDGVVYIDGELYNFKGGVKQSKVIIRENVEKLAFENGEIKDTFYTRWVEFGVGTNAINWTDLKRFNPFKGIHKEIRFVGGNITNAQLPDGWYIADGSNGTDDLRDKFIKVKKTHETAGRVSGSHERKLSIYNIPKMDVTFRFGSARDSQSTHNGSSWEASHDNVRWHNYTQSVGQQNPTAINIEPKKYLVVAIQYINK